MILVIPVSPFTKKIITAHRTEPVNINARDILYQTFNNIRTGRPVNMLEAEKILTEQLEIEITGVLKKSDLPYFYQAGLNMHRFHLHEMMCFIEGQVYGGGNASAAIRQFIEIYDLYDEDINMESIFRKWQRYWSDKKSKENIKNIFTKSRRKKDKERTNIEIVNIEEFHRQFACLLYENMQYFTTTDQKFRYKMYLHIKIHLFHHVLKYNIAECARIFGFSRRHIYNALSNTTNIMNYDSSIGLHIRDLLSLQYGD
jgi:hypothetical protein